MKKLLGLTMFLLCLQNIYSNKLIKTDSTYSFVKYTWFEPNFGASYLFNKEIDENFNWGFNYNIRFCFGTKNRKLSFAPGLGAKIFSSSMDVGNSTRNNLQIIKPSFMVEFSLYQSKNQKFKISNLFEVGYSFVQNFISWEVTNAYPTYNNNTTRETFDIFNGNTFSLMTGYRVKYKFVYFDIAYDLLETKVRLTDEFKQELDNEQQQYDPTPRFSLNSVNFNLGFSLQFEDVFSVSSIWDIL